MFDGLEMQNGYLSILEHCSIKGKNFGNFTDKGCGAATSRGSDGQV